LGQGAARGLALHDFHHLSANGTDLGGSGVGRLLHLVGAALGEGDGEKSEKVVVGRLDGNIRLDQSLPLSDKGSQLIGSEIEAVEVRQAVLSLDLVDSKSDLAERVILILL